MTKKIFVIDDWGEFWNELRSCGYRWRDVTQHSAEKYYDGNVSIDTVMSLLKPHELKDVVEFEATVQKIDWDALDERRTFTAIVNPPNVKPDDKLQVWFVVKQKEEPDDQK